MKAKISSSLTRNSKTKDILPIELPEKTETPFLMKRIWTCRTTIHHIPLTTKETELSPFLNVSARRENSLT